MKLSNLAVFVILVMVTTSMALAETPSFDLLNTQPETEKSSSNDVYMPPNVTIDVNEHNCQVLDKNLQLADTFLNGANKELENGLKADLDKVERQLASANDLLVEYFVVYNQLPQDTANSRDKMIEKFQLSYQLRIKATKLSFDQFDNMVDQDFQKSM